MAQLIIGTDALAPKLVSPPGYEVIDVGIATEAIPCGAGCIRVAGGWSLAPAGTKELHAIAAKKYAAGQGGCDFIIQGEIDGYDMAGGIVPGTDIFPSASVAGGLATDVPVWYNSATTPVVNVPVRATMRAVTATRIRVNFV